MTVPSIIIAPHVVAVSGSIASGKSTLAEALGAATGWKRASFGAYIRSIAVSRGMEEDRPSLQRVGQELVQNGTDSFVQDVLRFGGWSLGQPVILEGVRHLSVLEAVERCVAPLPVVLVHVLADDIARRARVTSRGEIGPILDSVEAHSTEADVRVRLLERADVLVDGAGDIDEEVARLMFILSQA